MSDTELRVILENHMEWIEDASKGERADFSNMDLSGADLRNLDLRGAVFNKTDLRSVDFRGSRIDYARFYMANMRGCNLSDVDLHNSIVSYVDLSYSNLTGSDLRYLNFYGCGLVGANILSANIYGAEFLNNEDSVRLPCKCPEIGEFTAWRESKYNDEYVVMKILVTENAIRHSTTVESCYVNSFIPLELQTIKGDIIENVCDKNINEPYSEFDDICMNKECKLNNSFVPIYLSRKELVKIMPKNTPKNEVDYDDEDSLPF